MLIQVENLSRVYRTPIAPKNWGERLKHLLRANYEDKLSVSAVNFNIAAGECVGLVGPNGAGKSTTIKMLTGILEPSSGRVLVAGYHPQRDRVKYVKKIGVVFGQRSQLWWDLPVKDSFEILQALFDVPQAAFKARLDLFRREANLDEFYQRPVRTLSLGQRMLCEIAAAFLHSPDVVFLDEPTIGLDLDMKARMRGLIRKLNQESGTTVLITSHDVGDIERLTQRLLLIDKGTLRFDGSLADFRSHAGDGRWWAARLQPDLVAAAEIQLRAHHSALPVRQRGEWLEIARHDTLPFAELMQLLAPYSVSELKPVEQEFEELLHGFYLANQAEAVC
ncbi:ATP-binding cassette domain-containing protein [uncultured Deefgea sp.]|uniref:ABC transporter ATP-binding protein n=1 Tax=uncultured Deefgea sp. TaxID=1304914 RepID=UPI002625E550|nr:ATP-binding cassette domain-containing protein [uncultured Deefgea sp.]